MVKASPEFILYRMVFQKSIRYRSVFWLDSFVGSSYRFAGTLCGIATMGRIYFPVETLYRIALKSDEEGGNVTTDTPRSAGDMGLSVARSARDDVRIESVVERTGAWFGRLDMR